MVEWRARWPCSGVCFFFFVFFFFGGGGGGVDSRRVASSHADLGLFSRITLKSPAPHLLHGRQVVCCGTVASQEFSHESEAVWEKP